MKNYEAMNPSQIHAEAQFRAGYHRWSASRHDLPARDPVHGETVSQAPVAIWELLREQERLSHKAKARFWLDVARKTRPASRLP